MARTYRDIAIEDMVRTVEDAMSRVIDWWGDLPPPMKDAVEQFRTQLGAAIDSVEFVKRALDRQVPRLTTGTGRAEPAYGEFCGPGSPNRARRQSSCGRLLVCLHSLPANEGKYLRIHDLGMGLEQAMRQVLVGLERAVL